MLLEDFNQIPSLIQFQEDNKIDKIKTLGNECTWRTTFAQPAVIYGKFPIHKEYSNFWPEMFLVMLYVLDSPLLNGIQKRQLHHVKAVVWTNRATDRKTM